MSDGGTWENKLIDLTAPGAEMNCHVFMDNWTIRNVAVVGVNESSTGRGAWWVRTNSSGATARMENIWIGDGDGGGDGNGDFPNTNDASGIFVDKNHAGTLTIDRLYAANWSDNGVYGSAPGVSDGAGGVVHIKNSYAENCAGTSFRVGTTGSTFENCVAAGGWDQGFRADEGGDVDAIKCSCSGHKLHAFHAKSGAVLNLLSPHEGYNFADDNPTGTSDGGTINGTIDGNRPRTSPPTGCPRSPAEAIAGYYSVTWNS